MANQAVRLDSNNDVSWLMEAVARMLRPVVRLAVGRVSCNALVNLLREIYVLEARDYLQAQNPERKVTRSSLALLCGMDGRAIQQFEQIDAREYTPSDVCSEAAILDAWQTDSDFLDEDEEKPRQLLIHGPQGTFQRLVSRAAGRAVTAQTALDRLLESGNVALSEDGTQVRLIDPYYKLVPSSEQAAIEAGSLSLNRLGRSILNNIGREREGRPAWLQQDRWSLRIPLDRIEQVRKDMRELLLKHIAETEQKLDLEEQSQSRAAFSAVGVGWYYWEDTSLEESLGGVIQA